MKPYINWSPVRGIYTLLCPLLLAGWTVSPARADVINFEDLTAGAPGGAGGPSAVLSSQYIARGVRFENAQGFDYSYGGFPAGFAHSGAKAIESWSPAWSDWTALGGFALQPGVALAANPAAAKNVFVLGGDGAVYRGWRSPDPSASSLLWDYLGSPSGTQLQPGLAVGRNADGRLEVFGLGSEGALYHAYETSVGGSWSGWYGLEGWQLQGPVATANDADGRLEVYVVGGTDHVETSPGHGTKMTARVPLVRNVEDE